MSINLVKNAIIFSRGGIIYEYWRKNQKSANASRADAKETRRTVQASDG